MPRLNYISLNFASLFLVKSGPPHMLESRTGVWGHLVALCVCCVYPGSSAHSLPCCEVLAESASAPRSFRASFSSFDFLDCGSERAHVSSSVTQGSSPHLTPVGLRSEVISPDTGFSQSVLRVLVCTDVVPLLLIVIFPITLSKIEPAAKPMEMA